MEFNSGFKGLSRRLGGPEPMWTVGEVGESDCVRHSVASVTGDLHSGTDGRTDIGTQRVMQY